MKKIKKIVYLTILMIFVSTSIPDTHVFAKITTCTTQTVSSDYIKKAKGEWYTYCPVGITGNNKLPHFIVVTEQRDRL